MFAAPFVAAVLGSLAALPALAQGQAIQYDSIHNATTIIGTWSSGSRGVQTGPGFVNPANQTFFYPKTTGISYSFDGNGNYEVARYRFNSNGTDPNCITGVVNWVHGLYTLVPNGSIILTPFGDGFQQIQDPCAPVSNFIENYNLTELYQSWRIFQDPNTGYKLHLFQFDGAPLAPQFQVSATPIMLPPRLLRNVSGSLTVQSTLQKRNGAPSAVGSVSQGAWNVAAGAGVLGLASLLL